MKTVKPNQILNLFSEWKISVLSWRVVATLFALLPAVVAYSQVDPPVQLLKDGQVVSNHVTIQAAINAAAAGDVIKVDSGTYQEHLLVEKSLTIEGPNSSKKGDALDRVAEAVLKGVIRVEANGVKIRGLAIDGAGVNQSTNLTARGILVGNTASRSNITIENNVIQDWVTGVSLAGGASFPWNSDVTIEGNKLVRASIGSTENVGALTITNNSFEACGLGLGGGAVLAKPITGNVFSGAVSRYVSAAAGVVADFGAILAANTFEKGVLTENAVGQWYDRAIFGSILGAVNVSDVGAVVRVLPGNYDEGVVAISKSVDIRGANFGIPARNPLEIANVNPDRGNESVFSGTFLLQSSGISIDGFSVTGAGPAVQASGTGQSNVAIRNNRMYANTGGRTIEYWGAATPATDWEIAGNHISDLRANDATAITVFNITGLEIDGNTILHSNSAYSGRRGMNVDGGRDVFLRGNYIDMGLVDPLYENSTAAFNSARYCVQLSSSDRSTERVLLRDNVMKGAYSGMITLGNGGYDDLEISENSITNVILGIRFQAGTNDPIGFHNDIRIVGNTVQADWPAIWFGDGGASADPYSEILIRDNILESAKDIAIVNIMLAADVVGTIDMRLNWWGSANGPSVATLQSLSGKADVSTWYVDQSLTTIDSTLPVENLTQNLFYESIQSAINAAESGDVIEVDPGTYSETIDLKVAGVTLRATGTAAETIIQGSGTAAAAATVRITANDVTVEGFTIDNVGKDAGCISGGNNAANVRILKNVIRNSGRGVRGDFYGTFGGGLVIDQNTFDTIGRGVTNTENIASITVTDNVFKNIAANGVSFATGVTSAVFTGNSFENVTGRHVANYQSGNGFDVNAAFTQNTYDKAVSVDKVTAPILQAVYSTISQAVLEAESGAVVKASKGTFEENVVTSKVLTLEGGGDETIIKPTTGVGISLAAGTDAETRSMLRNLKIEGNGSHTGLVVGSFTTLVGVTSTKHSNYGLNLSPGTDLIINGCHFDENAVGLKLASTASFTKIRVTDSTFDGNVQHGWYDDANQTVKPLLEDVIFTDTSFSGNGLKGLYTERLSNATFDGVTVSGNANSSGYNFGAGIDINLKWRAFSGITIRNSSFTNNGNGSLNGAGLTVKARDDAPSYSGAPASYSGLLVEDCVFSNNERHYVNGEPGKLNAGPAMVTMQRNRFGAATSGAVVNHALAQVNAIHNYWGAPSPNFATIVSGDVAYSPWYADEALLFPVSPKNFEDATVLPSDVPQTYENLYIGSGVTWTVTGTLQVTGAFKLEEGAKLEVVDGDLVFGDGSVMSGTFTFYNSFGSINFNDDVTISGSAEGLILVSDVHVANGATITVEGGGSFTIDGCTVDSDGTFELVVESGANFTMARTTFSDGTITIQSGGARIYDNRFDDTNIDVVDPSNGARIFHNVFSATTNFTDAGVGTVTIVDAWGNPGSEVNTRNNLPLGLDISMLSPTRTLSGGKAYIQPGDEIEATISVSKLQSKIAGVEVLLGYNTDYFATEDLGLGANWDSGAIFTEEDDLNVIGRFNASFALDFDFLDPAGTNTDQVVADLGLLAKTTAEGTTQVFHRVKMPEDTIQASRLATGGAAPGYLTPFTSNTGSIVIDGTDPLTNDLLTGASIEQDGQDMTQFVTVQGILEVSASAFDALAGIDTADLADTVVTLVGPATYTATRVSVGAGPNIDGNDYTTFGFEYEVTSTTLNGDYDVVFTVTDRSGNVTAATLGEITINKNEVTATVELEGLVAGNVTRQVDFVFTQANNAVIETRTRTVVFTNGVAEVNFTDVNGTTAFLSAKTATHLRERTAVNFDGNWQAAVAYTGAGELQGGDFNGDNIVNLLDYSILRFYWQKQVSTDPLAAAAEITGDGSVNLTDYQILQSNFYQQGDPQ